jgi:hypothetical protein
MACENITNYLANETSRLGPWFYQKKMFGKSPWSTLIKRETYPEGIGFDFRQITYERAAPTSILSWASANAYSNGEACGACSNSFNEVDVGYTTRTTTLYKYELKSRMICIEDMRPAWETAQQISAIRDQLGAYVRHAWDQKAREDTFLSTKYKVVADGSIDGNFTSTIATAYPSACATDVLQQAVLDYYYMVLVRDGAVDGAVGNEGGQPILPLICSPELSNALLVQNDAVRQDLRWANPSELMKPLGVSRVLKGFAHVIDTFPRRFQCVNGTYTEVAPFESAAKTVLTGAEVASAYTNAPYEEATIFSRDLWTQLVPMPKSTAGAGTSFNPVSYTGEWLWKNFDSSENVFQSVGRWYGRMFSAALKVRPEFGVSFVYRRCNPSLAALPSSCAYS